MKLKIFLLVVALAISVESGPISPKLPPIFDTPVGIKLKSDIELEEAPVPFLDHPIESSQVDELLDDDEISYRLPNNTIPLRYDLFLKTDVDKAIFDFDGQVKIHIKLLEPSQLVVLHYRQIDIKNIDLLDTDQSLIVSGLIFGLSEEQEFLRIMLPNTYVANRELILDITYNGTLRSDNTGFYRASYQNIAAQTVWFATTQFEMVDARHAMPCYDEPGTRAAIGLRIQHGDRYDAVSNMPVTSRLAVEGTVDNVITSFEDTPPMQTYLLAFIISDYLYDSNDDPETEQRVYGVPQKIVNGDGQYALGESGPVLRKLEEVLGVKYPLPKMDHAAIYDYRYGAMENFGLITYVDTSLLFNSATDADSKKKSITEIIAHEYAHQWFGNIVSPKWWSYNWLNEGFATLFSNYIPSLIHPELDHMERFQSAVDRAFAADTTGNKPMSLYVEAPLDIERKFDTIAYQKAGTVLRMFMQALTDETFIKGLHYYLEDMHYKAAEPADLHRNLQKAFDEDFPGNGVNLEQVMTTWEVQAGFPVVRVEKRGLGFTLTQTRSTGTSEIYSIPISYVTKSDFSIDSVTPKLWMTEKVAGITSDDAWILLNIKFTGYYRVSYDNSIMNAFIEALHENYDFIPAIYRVQLFRDISAQVSESSIAAWHGLDMLSYLNDEPEYTVWNRAYELANVLSSYIFATTADENYNEFIQSIIKPHLDRLTFEAAVGESTADADLRTIVTTLSCSSRQEECLGYQHDRLAAFAETGTGSYNLCEGLRLNDEVLHSTFMTRLIEATTTAQRTPYINALGCSLNRNSIKSFLQLILIESNSLSANERANVIENTFRKSVEAYETVLDFIEEYLDEIERIIPGQLSTKLPSIAGYTNSEAHFTRVESIRDAMIISGYLTTERVEAIAMEIQTKTEWQDEYFSDIELFLNGGTPTDPTDSTVGPTDSTNAPTVPVTADPTTTADAGSIVASFSLIVACALIKKSI